MITNPQRSVGCRKMEKQVTSNKAQLLLAESLEQWLGRQVLASFSLIRSSILVMKELHLRWNGDTLSPFLFLDLLKYHLLNFHAGQCICTHCKKTRASTAGSYTYCATESVVGWRVKTNISQWTRSVRLGPVRFGSVRRTVWMLPFHNVGLFSRPNRFGSVRLGSARPAVWISPNVMSLRENKTTASMKNIQTKVNRNSLLFSGTHTKFHYIIPYNFNILCIITFNFH